jgi:hypothetical protein
MTLQELKSQLLEGKISFAAATHKLNSVADQLNQLYPGSGPLIQKFWLLVHDHNIDHAVCDKSGQWRRYKSWKHGFSDFCGNQGSCECNRKHRHSTWNNRSAEVNQQSSAKRRATNLDRYGFEAASQHPEIKQKAALTCMAKFGVPAATLNPAVLEKAKQTNQLRYGSPYVQQNSEIRAKTRAIFEQHYGGSCPAKDPCVVKKTKETNMTNLGVPAGFLQPHAIDKNREHFRSQSHQSQVLSQSTLKPLFTKEEYVCGSPQQEYLFECNQCSNQFSSLVNSHVQLRCYNCFPKRETWGEVAIKQWLQDHSINFEQWNRKLISPRELDFWLPDHQVAIEFNGIWYHRHTALGDRNYHQTKWKMCHNHQIRLIQIWEHELLAKPEVIFDRLSHVLRLHQNKSVNARQCSIRPVEFDEAKPFVDMLHLQGHVPSSHAWGLIYQNQLVALANFVRSRYSKSAEWELARYCVAQGANVRGGLGKLISHAHKEIGFSSLVSYSNLNWGLGEGYAKTGFLLDRISKPNYWYFRGPKDVRSRVAFQKHKIQGQAPGSTESEIAANMGFEKFYDAGNAVWIRRW